jgi:hypothetical protein
VGGWERREWEGRENSKGATDRGYDRDPQPNRQRRPRHMTRPATLDDTVTRPAAGPATTTVRCLLPLAIIACIMYYLIPLPVRGAVDTPIPPEIQLIGHLDLMSLADALTAVQTPCR